jgi:phosphohistidine phosphatase
MRHAKAEPFAASDHERPLTDRGRAAAHDAGEHLRANRLRPEYAVVSSATRARETWDALVESAGLTDVEVALDDALFTGSIDVALETLGAVPPAVSTVMFVGHNPTAASLCHHLDDGDGDPTAVSELLQGFPPGAVAVLELSVPWAELGAETGRVVDFYVGRS